MALRSLDDTSGEPQVRIDAEGLRTVSWPSGRPAEVTLTVDLFEALLDEANTGRRALNALLRVVEAIGALGSPPDNLTGEPIPQVDTP